jgi:hypothetical protein
VHTIQDVETLPKSFAIISMMHDKKRQSIEAASHPAKRCHNEETHSLANAVRMCEL